MSERIEGSYGPDLRAIRSAIVALTLAVLAAGFIIADDHIGFALFGLSGIVALYSFVPTIIRNG